MSVSAVLYVKDLSRMRAFYEACFGLSVAEDADDHCTLGADHFMLSLVEVPTTIAASIAITTPPRRRADSPLKLGFEVADLRSTAEDVARRGGQVDDASTQWEHRGVLHRNVVDPEGNVVELLHVADPTSTG